MIVAEGGFLVGIQESDAGYRFLGTCIHFASQAKLQ
jgi:hypothetical protein